MFTVETARLESGEDWFFVIDPSGTRLSDPCDTREEANLELARITAQAAKLFDVTIRRTVLDGTGEDEPDTRIPVWALDEATALEIATVRCARIPNEWFRDEPIAVHEADLLARRAAADGDPRRCCSLAVYRPCVCAVSFTCPLHGTNCHGSHD